MESSQLPTVEALLAAARSAAAHAYAPYSHFSVGAAVATEQGLFTGCNVENASYGLTICAERNAVFRAVAAGARRILAVAIFTPTPEPTAPCGACRQVLLEFSPTEGAAALEVLSGCAGEAILRTTLGELLPHAFVLVPDRA